jgi:hypothetical protein
MLVITTCRSRCNGSSRKVFNAPLNTMSMCRIKWFDYPFADEMGVFG